MAMHVRQAGFRTMMKEGAQHFSGMEEAVFRNIKACKDIGEIVRTSFGPNGMNKLIINHLDKLFCTSDAAVILRELDVEHPAAKMLLSAAAQQEHEVGDGTNFVIMFSGKLLEKSEVLLRMGLSPAEVVDGYNMALKKALEILPELVCHTVEDYTSPEQSAAAIKTTIGSKHFGYEDFISNLVTEACMHALPKGPNPFNVDNVRVVKILGSGVLSSRVLKGMVFRRQLRGAVTHCADAKVAAYTCAVDTTQTETKGTVLINTAEELKKFSSEEEDLLESNIRAIKEAGVKVIVTTGKIGDMAQHFMNKYKLLGVKLTSKWDMRRLCRAVNATALPRLTPPTPSETGHCDEVCLEEIGDTTVTVFRQSEDISRVATIIIRGSTANIMDNVEHAIDDGVNVFKAVTKDQRLVPGAGATEAELSLQINKFGDSCPGLEQHSIRAFAEALTVVPFTLAENGGVKAQEVVARLTAAHQQGQKGAGYDNETGAPDVKDAGEAKIWDHILTKTWGLTYATEAATTVLSVDQIIMAKRAGGPKPPQNGGYQGRDD